MGVIRIRNNDRRNRAVLSIFTCRRVQVCGWEVIDYVSEASESCAFSCADGLFAEAALPKRLELSAIANVRVFGD